MLFIILVSLCFLAIVWAVYIKARIVRLNDCWCLDRRTNKIFLRLDIRKLRKFRNEGKLPDFNLDEYLAQRLEEAVLSEKLPAGVAYTVYVPSGGSDPSNDREAEDEKS